MGFRKVCFTHRYYDEDCHLLQAVPDCSSYLPVAIYDTSHQMSHQTSSSNHLLLFRHSPHTDGQGSPRSALRRVRMGFSSTGGIPHCVAEQQAAQSSSSPLAVFTLAVYSADVSISIRYNYDDDNILRSTCRRYRIWMSTVECRSFLAMATSS